jgi:hypothetical protein
MMNKEDCENFIKAFELFKPRFLNDFEHKFIFVERKKEDYSLNLSIKFENILLTNDLSREIPIQHIVPELFINIKIPFSSDAFRDFSVRHRFKKYRKNNFIRHPHVHYNFSSLCLGSHNSHEFSKFQESVLLGDLESAFYILSFLFYSWLSSESYIGGPYNLNTLRLFLLPEAYYIPDSLDQLFKFYQEMPHIDITANLKKMHIEDFYFNDFNSISLNLRIEIEKDLNHSISLIQNLNEFKEIFEWFKTKIKVHKTLNHPLNTLRADKNYRPLSFRKDKNLVTLCLISFFKRKNFKINLPEILAKNPSKLKFKTPVYYV